MIELFSFINEKSKKRINLESESVSYWASDSDKIKEFIKYIQDNKDLFYIDTITYESNRVMDKDYINAFKVDVRTNEKTYEYLFVKYSRVFSKYNARNVNIDYLKLKSIGDKIKESIPEEW